MILRELLTEAVYDNVAAAIKRAHPDQASAVDAELIWAKSALQRPDRINWYMLVVKNYFNNKLTPQVLGNYRFTTLDQLHNDLIHFYGFNVPSIANYAYKQQTIGEILSALDQLLKKHQEAERLKPKPVTPQTGDHVLFDFGGGIQWWFVDRGYCPDEGRSGNHCGNVAGQDNTDQRLLSLRKNGHVLLTFVLEPDGKLGEMKAWGNQKPAGRYHPYIAKLLMWDKITGITGGGWDSPHNFSMFDFSENDLAFFDQNKPRLIADQCQITPIEILKAPASIQKKYQQYVGESGVYASTIQDVIAGPSMETWGTITDEEPSLIMYAPHDMPGFEEKLLYFSSWADDEELLIAPSSISRNFDLLNKIMATNGLLISGVDRSIRGYRNLCLTAVKNKGGALRNIPKKLRDREMCLTAVSTNGRALGAVPKELRDQEMCLTAVEKTGDALVMVPEELRDREMCLTAVSNGGSALYHVPQELRDREMCLTAVKNNSDALADVPKELKQEIKQIMNNA